MRGAVAIALIIWTCGLALAILLLLSIVFTGLARAQHPDADMDLHNKFYSHWLQPDSRSDNGSRYVSCCSNRDCYPTTMQKQGGKWFAHNRPGQAPEWVEVPAKKLEHNYPDAEESPDGQSHACINPETGQVYCAVLGAAT